MSSPGRHSDPPPPDVIGRMGPASGRTIGWIGTPFPCDTISVTLRAALLSADRAQCASGRGCRPQDVVYRDREPQRPGFADRGRVADGALPIHVVHDTTISDTQGLGRKTGSKITWRWMVGSATHAGSWPVQVDSGKSGQLSLRLHVLPAGEP